MEETSITSWQITKYYDHLQTNETEEIVCEQAMTIMINGEQYATIVCSPVNVRELIIGFMATEGVIRSVKEIKNLSVDTTSGFSYVELDHELQPSTSHERWIGSCCGKSREFYLKQDVKTAKTIMHHVEMTSRQVRTLMAEFDSQSQIHERTGGVHQAALTDGNQILCTFIDIGRHNALDKLYGYILTEGLSMRGKMILFSGRMSSEIILKVSKIGSAILLAKSAPTDLALKLANDLRMTTVGFIRQHTLNVYTHHDRIIDETAQASHKTFSGGESECKNM